MKRLLLTSLLWPLGLCLPAGAQFQERPATTELRRSRLATQVQGPLRKTLDFPIDGRVSALSFSPKGDFLAVATATTLSLLNEAGTRRTVIWDATKETPVPFEDRPALKMVVAFAADGKALFFCGPHGLSVWTWPEGVALEQSPVRAWTAPDVYNVVVAEGGSVVCAAKKGSRHFLQNRDVGTGQVLWEKESGLLPITSLWSRGTSIRSLSGNATGSQCFWSEWNLSDGKPSFPVDLGPQNAFSGSFSPDGRSLAMVSRSRVSNQGQRRALNILTLETGDAKVALAPTHDPHYPNYSLYYGLDYFDDWVLDWRVDTGWATHFSPDGNYIATLGKEAVFYNKTTGAIEGRVFYSDDPYPDPITTQAEADGIGGFSADGKKFALVRQARVVYSATYNTASEQYQMRRQPLGNSAVEVYALGGA